MTWVAARIAAGGPVRAELADHGGRNGQPLSVWTISHIHRTLRKALADAVNVDQVLAVNPAARSKRPRQHGSEPTRVWTAGQLAAFLATASTHRLYAFYRLAAYTGARHGELLYLRWPAIDLDAAEITLGGSVTVIRGSRVEGTTKGGRSRVISIDADTVTILREHRQRQAEERQSAGTAWNGTSGLVFTTRWGEPLFPDTVTALMTKLINRHNQAIRPPARPLPHARLHDLRHYADGWVMCPAVTFPLAGVAELVLRSA
ncbi:MAG: tyrosine-type recombinase/integrase [Streptosporangiaceae bacterium]